MCAEITENAWYEQLNIIYCYEWFKLKARFKVVKLVVSIDWFQIQVVNSRIVESIDLLRRHKWLLNEPIVEINLLHLALNANEDHRAVFSLVLHCVFVQNNFNLQRFWAQNLKLKQRPSVIQVKWPRAVTHIKKAGGVHIWLYF